MSRELTEEVNIKIETFDDPLPEEENACDINEASRDSSTTLSATETDFKTEVDPVEIGGEVTTTSVLTEPVINISLTCEKCHEDFSSLLNLQSHKSSVHGQQTNVIKYLKCSKCNATFMKQSSLNAHLLCHDKTTVSPSIKKNTTYFCKACESSYRTSDALKYHIETYHLGIKPFKCTVCGKGFTRKRSLIKHLTIHSGEKPFKCRICGINFRLKDILKYHLTTVHSLSELQTLNALENKPANSTSTVDSKRYTCITCNEKFTSQNILQSHMSSVHKGAFKYLSCSQCSATFMNQYGLKAHLLTHKEIKPNLLTLWHPGNEKNKLYDCKICDITYKSKPALRYHIDSFHQGLKPFKCTHCTACFKLKSSLTKHLDVHSLKKKYTCALCSVDFSLKKNVKEHLITVHEVTELKSIPQIISAQNPIVFEKKSFACAICCEKLDSRCSVKEHIRNFHQNIAHKCPSCDAIFTEKYLLNYHLRRHTGIKPFACSLCSYRSEKLGHLKRHLLRKHKLDNTSVAKLLPASKIKKRTYNCKICNSTFESKDKLEKHISSLHSDIRPFKCKVCDVSFTSKYYLKIHSTMHAVKKPNKCNICSRDFRLKTFLKNHLTKFHGIFDLKNQPNVPHKKVKQLIVEVNAFESSSVFPPPLATPPVRVDPSHPCQGVKVTSDLLLSAEPSNSRMDCSKRSDKNYTTSESNAETCEDGASGSSYCFRNIKSLSESTSVESENFEQVYIKTEPIERDVNFFENTESEKFEHFEEMYIKTEPIVVEVNDTVDPFNNIL